MVCLSCVYVSVWCHVFEKVVSVWGVIYVWCVSVVCVMCVSECLVTCLSEWCVVCGVYLLSV